MGDLAIDVYLPGTTNTPSPLAMHQTAFQTNYVSETGNHVGAPALPTVATTQSWFVLSRVDVLASASVGGVVTFGDSITDGTRSTPNTNNRWPDQLMRRAVGQPGGPSVAIMNAGIGGNRVLSEGAFNAGINALSRFDLNALSYPGVTHIVAGRHQRHPAGPAESDADRRRHHRGSQAVDRTGARAGIRIYGATLTPFYGAGNYTDIGEAKAPGGQ
jgi:hypothetical protein